MTEILVEFEPKDMSVRIPVVIEFETERVTRVSGEAAPRKNMALMIERGLRAQLQLQSLVTGQLMVAIDFHPDKPARLIGVDDRYPEFPTIATRMQEVTKTLEDLPIEELVNKVMLTLEGLEKLVNSPEIIESVRTLNETLKEVQVLTQNLGEKSGPITSNIEETTKAATATLKQVDKTLYLVEGLLAEDSEPRRELVMSG